MKRKEKERKGEKTGLGGFLLVSAFFKI